MNGQILVTGASSGIGREISIMLSQSGFQCILTGRDEDKLAQTIMMLSGSNHFYISGDLNDINVIDKIVEKVGFLCGVIHSAGIIKLAPWKYVKRNVFEGIMNINLYSPFFLTQALLKKNKLLNGSSILFISSISGPIIGSKGNLMYSASKSAINGLVKVLALELAEKNIRVNVISAGMIMSEMWSDTNNIISSDQLLEDSKKYPLGYGKTEDVASMAVFLMSDKSKWITGSTIVLDGGFSIQ